MRESNPSHLRPEFVCSCRWARAGDGLFHSSFQRGTAARKSHKLVLGPYPGQRGDSHPAAFLRFLVCMIAPLGARPCLGSVPRHSKMSFRPGSRSRRVTCSRESQQQVDKEGIEPSSLDRGSSLYAAAVGCEHVSRLGRLSGGNRLGTIRPRFAAGPSFASRARNELVRAPARETDVSHGLRPGCWGDQLCCHESSFREPALYRTQ